MLNYGLLHFVRNDGGISVLGGWGFKGVRGDASQVEPLAPLGKVIKKKSLDFFEFIERFHNMKFY